VSQVHLAVDVAHAPLDQDQLSRYVSRSRTQAVYEVAQAEVAQLLRMVGGEEADAAPLLMDWDALYGDAGEGDAGWDGLAAYGVRVAAGDEPEPAEERASTVYRWGKRLSGVAFSPGGGVSVVLYDKVLQGRLSGKRHMESIWAAAGWQLGVPVTRHEARLRRTAIRELGLPSEWRSCLDDPWECLTHLQDVFGAIVGHTAACPDAVDVAWIRRVVPDERDTNRSRWPTDPTWRVVQGATFADAPAEARRLIRRNQRSADVAVLDRGLYGYLVSRVALQHPNGGEWTVSRALGEARAALDALEVRTGKDFGELVRERRRSRGLALPFAEKVLPFRAPGDTGTIDQHLPLPHAAPGHSRLEAQLDVEEAEMRVAEAWLHLDAAERRGAMTKTLREWEDAFHHEVAIYQKACTLANVGAPDAS
jgi:hypothetical protein